MHCKRKCSGPWQGGIETQIFLLKGLYKLEGQMAGKNWVVFAGWARVIDSLIDKVVSYNMECSAHALVLTLRYFNYMYEV
jgi:hypothetical protein